MKDNKIKQLDKDISNKIAAGEVVERPLAVVKELVENAIDAGANKITVEIREAGKSLIRITDNGHGIHPDDVVLAFERHSTSKIRTINDIYHISSLGFRGEALASIASVSMVELITKHLDYEMGKKLVLEGGKVVEHLEIGAPQGTTILIKDLFFNTPARKKFMKSNNAEQNAINDIMNKLALSHPEVSFKYIVGGKSVFMSPGNGKMYDVILNIFERNIARNLLELNHRESETGIEGYISTIDLTRGNRQYQIVFVNNRYVRSKTIDDAVALAYRTMIPHNRFPIVFLNINIDPSLIDINIHPAKTEIRFHQEGFIKDLVYKAIATELNRYNLIPKKPLNSKPVDNRQVLSLYQEMNEQVSENLPAYVAKNVSTNAIEEKSEQLQGNKVIEQKAPEKKAQVESYGRNALIPEKSLKDQQAQIKVFNEEMSKLQTDKTEPKLVRPSNHSEEKKAVEKPLNRPMTREPLFVEEIYEPIKMALETPESTIYDSLLFKGSIFNTYLIFEKNDEMYLMDQHAAHEKILFEQYVTDFRNRNIASQMILEPITIHVNYMDKDNILAHENEFQRLGFSLDSFGEDLVIVREIPSIFTLKTAEKLIKDMIENISFDMPSEQFELYLDNLMQQSCKAAIKANDHLHEIEVDALINQLKTLQDPYTCPHGRPIIISIGRKELEKKFNRI